MQIRIRLLGTLSACFQGQYPPAGIDIQVPAGATVAEVVDAAGIPRERVAIVTINGLLAKADDRVPEHAIVKFMQPITGG